MPGTPRWILPRWLRQAAVVQASLVLSACVVPDHMHVTEGVSPRNSETNVRFRTTYYFRVFDFCWAANANIVIAAGEGGQITPYRALIPETDTLYRYRMTGKASALFDKIKFESGTLTKSQIDPFGTQVSYNADAGGFVTRTPEEARAVADAAQRRRDTAADAAAILARYDALRARYDLLGPESPGNKDRLDQLKVAMAKALDQLNGTESAVSAADIAALKTQIMSLNVKFETEPAAAKAMSDANKATQDSILTSLKAVVADALKTIADAQAKDDLCPPQTVRRKGFQLMGPEGIREYSQDDRLILAMFSSAKPLTETLQEYAGRVLAGKTSPAEQLLPLARENIAIIEAQRAVDRAVAKGDAMTVDTPFADALAAFGEPK